MTAATWQLDIELAALARDVLRTPAEHVADSALEQLASVVRLDEQGKILRMAGRVAVPAELTALVTATDDIGGARRLHAAWQREAAAAVRHSGTDASGSHMAMLSPAEQERFAREALALRARDVTPDQWRRLQQLIDDPPSRLALQAAVPGRDVRTMVRKAGGGAGMSAACRFHADWTLSQPDDAGRIELARRVFGRSPERLVEGEWAIVEALARSQVPGPRTLAGVNRLEAIARAQTHEILDRPTTSWNAHRYFSAWNQAIDPGYLQRVHTAVEEVAAGRATPEAIELLLIEREGLGSLVEGRPAPEQRRLAAALLGRTGSGATGEMKDLLELAGSGVRDARGIHPGLEPLRRRTLELVDLNLARIAGMHPDGAPRGYANHPNYADIGRIRANIDLMENASRSRGDGEAVESFLW